jgi:NADH dehydrogenase [ubiquinone] 1 alpha subcomplex assembly factor 2
MTLKSDPRAQAAQESPEVQEVGWDGEVRAKVPGKAGGGLKEADQPEDSAKGEAPKMQVPDHKRHPFNVRPDGTRIKEKKYQEDPWKQARGTPSEEWQPEAWSPDVATTKR